MVQVVDIIDQMVEKIRNHFHPEKIILFGSYAGGSPGRDSDVDLLVVMPVAGSVRKKSVEIRCVLHGMGVAKDIIVVTPESLSKYGHIPGSIIHHALTRGTVLYEQ